MRGKLLITILVSISMGCTGQYELVEQDEPPAPTGTSRIVSQSFFGTPSVITALRGLERSSPGGFSVHGEFENSLMIGSLSPDGRELRVRNVDFTPEDIIGVPSFGGVDPGTTLFLGWGEADDTHQHDYLVLDAYQGLDIRGDFELSSDTVGIWANGMAVVSETGQEVELIAVGGVTDGRVDYPLMLRVKLAADFSWTVLQQRTFYDHPMKWFSRVVVSPDGSIFVGGQHSESADSTFVVRFAPQMDILWEKAVRMENGTGVAISDMVPGANELFLFGDVAETKESVPGWRSGFIAKMEMNGGVQWRRVYRVSSHSDWYSAGAVDGTFLYACGGAFGVMWFDTNRHYGLALLTRVESMTGQLVYHHTFGDRSYQSGFCKLDVRGSEVRCVGWTRRGLHTYGYQGWYVNIDLAGAANGMLQPLDLGIQAERARHPAAPEDERCQRLDLLRGAR